MLLLLLLWSCLLLLITLYLVVINECCSEAHGGYCWVCVVGWCAQSFSSLCCRLSCDKKTLCSFDHRFPQNNCTYCHCNWGRAPRLVTDISAWSQWQVMDLGLVLITEQASNSKKPETLSFYLKTVFLNLAQSYVNHISYHTIQDFYHNKVFHKCDHCDYESNRI